MKFSVKAFFSICDQKISDESEEILNEKLYFLCNTSKDDHSGILTLELC